MSRPKSMPDFTVLMDASTPIFEKRIHNRRSTSPERKLEHLRKKPSISLAAGLIMNSESPKTTGPIPSPRKQSRERTIEEEVDGQDDQDGLFYAYALNSDYRNSPPNVLTFASAAICSQWWTLVKREYPDSTRPSSQFFVLKSYELEQIQDNPSFFDLQHKWFYTAPEKSTGPASILPLQNMRGDPIAAPQRPTPETKGPSAIDALSEKLDRLAGVVEVTAEQIHALSVAQSAGLQTMQEINESNSTQIMAIADAQIKLQALVDQNASHYIALSNTSFQSQEKIKEIMKTTATQIQNLSKNHAQLVNTCDGMTRGIDSMSDSVSQLSLNVSMSDTASNHSTPSAATFSAMANRISPPPRKLNRRIKGVWYEYDTMSSTPTGSPKRSVNFVDTPPKSPLSVKNAQ
ncbi:hypothetical protein IQ07DRAFT_30302 [Pyrenochaeta sp. DS3sAY3a]|nr:hypothetical protein IQ07DRAFT_30302 [Pyrenochaeta sp. DS3sAY3a]